MRSCRLAGADAPADGLLDAEWHIFKTLELGETLIPNKYKELMGVAVHSETKCRYRSSWGLMTARVDAREGKVEVVGGRIWYRIVGAGTAVPLVTVHGDPGATHDYLEPLEALADDRPVVFYDQLYARTMSVCGPTTG